MRRMRGGKALREGDKAASPRGKKKKKTGMTRQEINVHQRRNGALFMKMENIPKATK